MSIKLKPKQAIEIFSKEIKAALKDPKFKGATSKDLSYELSWVVNIEGYTFDQILNPPVVVELTEAEELERSLKRIGGVYLRMVHKRKVIETKIDGIPEIIKESYRNSIADDRKEKKRFDEMSNEEKKAETARILAELRKHPGFVQLVVPKKK